MEETVAVSRLFAGSKRLARFSLVFLLAFSTAPSAQKAFAQGGYVWCIVTVPNAGDPIQDGYSGQPKHYYHSAVIQGGDPNNRFLTWARKHFGSTWVKNPYSHSDQASENCDSRVDPYFQNDLEVVQQKRDLFIGDGGYNPGQHAFNTPTNWPNVPQP
jgi:hypothetical protein